MNNRDVIVLSSDDGIEQACDTHTVYYETLDLSSSPLAHFSSSPLRNRAFFNSTQKVAQQENTTPSRLNDQIVQAFGSSPDITIFESKKSGRNAMTDIDANIAQLQGSPKEKGNQGKKEMGTPLWSSDFDAENPYFAPLHQSDTDSDHEHLDTREQTDLLASKPNVWGVIEKPMPSVCAIDSQNQCQKAKKLNTIDSPSLTSRRVKKASKSKSSSSISATQKSSKFDASTLKLVETLNKRKVDRLSTASELVMFVSEQLYSSELFKKTQLQLDLVNMRTQKWTGYQVSGCQFIRFDRKVRRKFDDEIQLYVPAPLEIIREPFILVVVRGEDFAHLTSATLDAQIKEIRSHTQEKDRIVYIICCLEEAKRKLISKVSRSVTREVRRALNSEQHTSSSQDAFDTQRASKEALKRIPELLLDLQLVHKLQVITTDDDSECADWIYNLSVDWSCAPYNSFSVKGADVGFIKSGTSAEDCLFRSLTSIKFVTPPVAQAIGREFSSLYDIGIALEEKGPRAIEGISKPNGSVIGKSLAKTIHRIFTCTDPDTLVN